MNIPAASAENVPIGITMGCPAGIGPEIIVKFLHDPAAACLPVAPVVIGDHRVLFATADALGLPLPIRSWQPGQIPQPGCLNLLAVSKLDPATVRCGEPNLHTGRAMAAYIDSAITLCRDGLLGAMVTGPISKAALQAAGYQFPGHTEMLAARTGASRVAMLLTGPRLRVVPLTTHCALEQVAGLITREDIVDLVHLVDHALQQDFALDRPRIAVAALNPHAGEGGLFGTQERDIIAPAVATCLAAGIRISGPHPPDTVFYQATAGRFDVVICMYHDQGLIPFKLIHFADGVNCTLGLPIIRTSVDHGTAYDIAGRGVADPHSLACAVNLAACCATNRRNRLHAGTTPSKRDRS